MEILLYALVGATAGFVGGLLGIGGGLVAVPLLSIYLAHAEFPADTLMQVAIGTSLAAMITTTLSAAIAHEWRGASGRPFVRLMGIGLVIGSFTGSLIADSLSSDTLSTIFGLLAFLLSIYFFFDIRWEPQTSIPTQGYSFLIGILSSLMGIGAGAFGIPFIMTYLKAPIHQAIAGGAALSLLVSIAGTIFYLIAGLNTELPPYTIGYIYLPAVLGISLTSPPFAWLGAKTAHSLNSSTLKKVFALFLFIVSLKFLISI